MAETIAIITARGGSKRIPRKNIKDFCGKPILAYPIEAAKESGLFDEIMVSTEDMEIAGIAQKYGAKVPFFRSRETSDDMAATSDVLREVLKKYQSLGREFERAVCIYPTAPFITSSRLFKAMELLEKESTDTVINVTAFSFPPLRGMYQKDGYMEYAFEEYSKARSQDLPVMYHDCGQFYAFWTKPFLKTNKLISNRTRAIIWQEQEVQDIDTYEDWILAEEKYKRIMTREEGQEDETYQTQ